MNPAELTKRFESIASIAPDPRGNRLTTVAKEFALELDEYLPEDTRAKSLAFTKLEEFVLWSLVALASK